MNLSTQRTTILPIQEKDIPDILEMYIEPDSFKYIGPLANKTVTFYTEFLQKKITTNKTEVGFWVVREKKNNSFIGTVNLNQFQDSVMTHIGCHLKSEHWNKGYAKELVKELLNYGTSNRKLEEIFGVFDVDNTVSRKLLEGLGFKPFEKRQIQDKEVNIYRYCSTEN
jgi:ribosomal-protein-alanine N-acetyltransferase